MPKKDEIKEKDLPFPPATKKISMEAMAEAARKMGGNGNGNGSRKDDESDPKEDIVKNILSYLLDAEGMKLLQLTPIPRNAIFDIAFDITQRYILDENRIAARIPLSEIFMEAYLRAVRGANQMLPMAVQDMARTQIEGQSEVNPIDEFNR